MNPPAASPPPGPRREPRSIWTGWPRRRILVLALMLAFSDFTLQFLVIGLGGGGYLAVLVGGIAGVLAPLVWMARRIGAVFAGDLGLDRPRPGVLVAAAVMAVAALLPVSLLAELSLRLTPPGDDWISQAQADLPRSTWEFVLVGITVVLVVPLVEEIIFRGLVQRLVATFIGPGQAVVYAAVLFAVAHLLPWLFLGLVGVGLVLGFVYRATGSVTASAVAHAVHNGVSLYMLIRNGEENYAPTALTVQEAGLTVLSLAALLAAGRWLWIRGRPT